MKRKIRRDELILPMRPADMLRDIDAEPIFIGGTTMSKREAHLRLVYARALKGDPKASKQLQQVRDACGLDKSAVRVGYLVLPEPPDSLEQFAKMAFEQQRQFRETPCSEDLP